MSAQLAEGTIFAGRYRVVRCLAAGGMGAVYEVVHLETERSRALKVMHPHLFQSDEMRERFKRETRIAAHVESEYIVDVSDAGVDEATSTPFLVMELLRGEDLGDRRKRLGRFPAAEVVTYLQQAAWALDRTHAASIVHRDLKPQNIYLTQREDGSPRIKILDFGVAKVVAEGATAAGATQSLGTPLYMAPEQFRIDVALTSAADIYALTMIAYTLLVGKSYWSGEAKGAGDPLAFALVAVQGPKESAVRRAAAEGVTLPAGFDAWFAQGTALNPAHRFRKATDAVRALGEVLGITTPARAAATPAMAPAGGRPVLSSDPMTPGVLRQTATASTTAVTTVPVKRRRAPIATLAAVLGLGVLGAGAWLVLRPPNTLPAAAPLVVTAAAPAVSLAAPVEPTPSVVPTLPEPSATASAAAPPITVVKPVSKPVAVVKKPPALRADKSLLGQE